MNTEKQYISEQLITYIGNKRKLFDFIEQPILDIKTRLGKEKLDLFDGFAGSGGVSRFLKRHAAKLLSNDLEKYSAMSLNCYLTNRSEVDFVVLDELFKWLEENKRNGEKGIISRLYSPRDDQNIEQDDRVFYTNDNALILDVLSEKIRELPESVQPLFFGPLLYRASVHTNTSGVFKGFYKDTATKTGKFGGNAANCLTRITSEISIDVPVLSTHEVEYEIHNQDINVLIKTLPEVDVAYYDPPYNQHPYGSNYFMLNVLLSNEEPTNLSKVSGIPADWNKSAYNKKQPAMKAFDDLLEHTNAKFIVMSYSDGGILSLEELSDICSKYGKLTVLTKGYPIFRGRRKSETLVHRDIKEYLFVVEK